MSENGSSKANLPTTSTPTQIALTPSASMDLSWMSEEDRRAILRDYTSGMLNIAKKAQELNVDVGGLKNTLDTLAKTTREVTADGNNITATHTTKTTAGTTTIVMGNTDEAKRGQISSDQMGLKNWTPIYILAGIGAVVIIAALLG